MERAYIPSAGEEGTADGERGQDAISAAAEYPRMPEAMLGMGLCRTVLLTANDFVDVTMNMVTDVSTDAAKTLGNKAWNILVDVFRDRYRTNAPNITPEAKKIAIPRELFVSHPPFDQPIWPLQQLRLDCGALAVMLASMEEVERTIVADYKKTQFRRRAIGHKAGPGIFKIWQAVVDANAYRQ